MYAKADSVQGDTATTSPLMYHPERVISISARRFSYAITEPSIYVLFLVASTISDLTFVSLSLL